MVESLFTLLSLCYYVLSASSLELEQTKWGNLRTPRELRDIGDKIYVHVVPHTHDDVGWLETVDEYYYGANSSIQHAAVQYILDTVIEQLLVDKDRTFIYVEMAFFARWWNQQSDQTKETVKLLVQNKQLEFVNAGWCMNDEAGTHYNAIIDQMTLGLKFVKDTFGDDARPRVAWQIDPFGHSNEMATIFALMGYDALFFARNDYDDKNQRLKDNTMEFIWRASMSLGDESDIFTGIFLFHYGPPPGFCFDVKCTDPPIQDDPNLMGYNVDERVDAFIRDVLLQAGNYRTEHIMFTFGSDFHYENAMEYYRNIDKLMMYTMKKEPRIQMFYSTPSRYMDAINQASLVWYVNRDDFFPYADLPYAYWTGYFTSRPALKGYAREMNSLLQICKQLEAIGEMLKLRRQTTTSSLLLQKALGVAQHHDAISGTERQNVADDYAKRLHIGQVECEALVADVAGAYVSNRSHAPPPKFQACELLNVSICPATEQGNFNTLIYNPIGRTRYFFMKFPVNFPNFVVTDNTGRRIMAQVVNISAATVHARTGLPGGTSRYELIIRDSLPAAGFKTYFVRTVTDRFTAQGAKVATLSPTKKIPRNIQQDIVLENDAVQVVFNGSSKRVQRITNKLSRISVSVDQGFYWYNSSDGRNVDSIQRSGAYIFRPNGTKPFDVNPNGIGDFRITQGDLFMEATQVFNPWVYQSVKIYRGLPFVEFEFTVGPIPIGDDLGKEIISRFSTALNSNKTWYTDANGRAMQQRIRNFRPNWNLNVTAPVSGNYYPVNSRIYMRDVSKNIQFTVMTDRSQGGSSLNDGQLELMVHRRLIYDDNRGVVEPLNEPGVDGKGLIVRGRHLVLIDGIDNSTYHHRMLGEMMMMRELPLFVSDSSDPRSYMQNYTTNFTGILRELPDSIHLLTLQSLGNGSYLLRLEHQFEYEMNGAEWVKPVTLSLPQVLIFQIMSVVELTLGANALKPAERLKWKTNASPMPPRPSSIGEPVLGPAFSVTLYPMEIRTFQITTV